MERYMWQLYDVGLKNHNGKKVAEGEFFVKEKGTKVVGRVFNKENKIKGYIIGKMTSNGLSMNIVSNKERWYHDYFVKRSFLKAISNDEIYEVSFYEKTKDFIITVSSIGKDMDRTETFAIAKAEILEYCKKIKANLDITRIQKIK